MPQSKDIENSINEFQEVLKKCPEITYVGNKILRQKTHDTNLEEGKRIADKLKFNLAKYRKITGVGRGLAAPQVGENKSVFITYIDDTFKTYINPKIIEASSKNNLYRESCLSCGGYLSVDVKRPVSITIEYLSESGNIEKEFADGFLARLIQHEADHLNGIVNIDKAEPGTIELMSENPLEEKLREVVN